MKDRSRKVEIMMKCKLWLVITTAISSLTVATVLCAADPAMAAQARTNQQLAAISQLQQQDGTASQNHDEADELLKNYLQRHTAVANTNNPSSNKPTRDISTAKPRQVVPPAKQPAEDDNSVEEVAFDNMTNNLLPLTPLQIHRLHQMFAASQKAAAQPAGVPPKPTATSETVDLSPGATPPVIRLGQGFVTSLVFLDASGAPWQIDNYDIGDPKVFNIVWNKKDNTLMIQAQEDYKYGNLAIRLKGLNTPVMITLIPGQQVVDYRVDMRLPLLGPNARKIPNSSGLPKASSNQLLAVLNGLAPQGAKNLEINGANAEGWAYGNVMYIRTRDTILSPSWLATMSSADGTNVYKMQLTPTLLVFEAGKTHMVTVKGL